MRLRHRALAVAVAVGGLLGALVAAPPAAQAVVPAPPKAGVCYNYTLAQAQGTSSPTGPVSCGSQHRAVTMYVGSYAGAAASIASVNDPRLFDIGGRACTRNMVSRFGARHVLARVSWVWFAPTQAQWDAGARWFRCDLIMYKTMTSLQYVPANILYALTTAKGINTYRRCLSSADWQSLVPCSWTHRYRIATYVWLASTTAPYPGDGVVEAGTYAKCKAALGRWAEVVTYPLTASWATGARWGRCFV